MPNFKGQQPEKLLPEMTAEGENKLDPKMAKQAENYETLLINLMHGPQMRDEVVNMLKASGDPIVGIPQAAMAINDMALMTMKKSGINVPPAIQLIGSKLLLSDLAYLGEASGAFEEVSDEEMAAIAEDTYQMYVERGLKDKSIDPIQLQLEAEKIMPDDMAAFGVVYGAGQVSSRPSKEANFAIQRDAAVEKALNDERATVAQRSAKEKQKALLMQGLRGGK